MKYTFHELTVIFGNLINSHIAQLNDSPEFRDHYSRGSRQYLILSILVAEIDWTGIRIDFFDE